jgi:hypothetical protein
MAMLHPNGLLLLTLLWCEHQSHSLSHYMHIDDPEGMAPGSKASDADTIQAIFDNIEAPRDEIFVHIGPRKARSNLDSPTVFTDDNVIELNQRDVNSWG